MESDKDSSSHKISWKAVCTDIDGTLLDARRQLSLATIEAFKKIPGDIPVILASSRMPSAMTHLQHELGVLHRPMICYNGGYVVHYNGASTPEVIDNVQIPADVCERIVRLAAGTSINTSLYHADEWFAPVWDHWTEREARITKVEPRMEDSLAVIENWRTHGNGGHKLMCMGPENEINAMEDALRTSFGHAIHIYRSRPTYLELASIAVSKGSALKLLLDRKFGISLKQTIVFGDNYNDIDMLEAAGHGVAVADARPEVKAVANEVTFDSKSDGVAHSLRKHFDL
jgi:Cof subfamily protein (haloacid dehalogenase superfamily)